MRSGHTATLLLDGRVLVAGGDKGSLRYASAEFYLPTPAGSTAPGATPGPTSAPSIAPVGVHGTTPTGSMAAALGPEGVVGRVYAVGTIVRISA